MKMLLHNLQVILLLLVILLEVKVSNRSGAGNGHFRDFQTTAKAEDLIFYRKCDPKLLLTATTLAGPSIKHGVLGGYILKKQRKRTKICLKSCISSICNGGAI